MNQKTFTDIAYESKKKKTRKEIFLGEMNEVLPWSELLSLLRKAYPKGERGRPPIELEVMLRIYFMQQWYQLGDESMEDALYENETMRRFADVRIGEVPDETTLCKFRHFLEKHNKTKDIFIMSCRHLEERGLLLKEGTIMDATIIQAPSSTKNKEKKRDGEMRHTRKGQQCYFGLKAHIGTALNGAVHTVVVTDASVNDSLKTKELLHGEEKVVHGDRGYGNKANQFEWESLGKIWGIIRKAKCGQKLSEEDKAINRANSRIRCRIEHVFGVVKNLWGYRKVRYKGLAKNEVQIYSLMALANIYMFRHKLA